MHNADFARLVARDGPVVFVPVRHHSPASAAAVLRLFDLVRPAQVLIEGPADFTPRLGELALPHRPPLALYAWLRLADGGRRAAFYPFCAHSPEWVALRTAAERGIPTAFIDLPWPELAAEGAAEQRYSDRALRRSRAVQAVAARLGVVGFDGIWDELVEVHRDLDPDEYLRRVHRLCGELREAEEGVEGGDAETHAREEHMAARIAEAARGPLPLLVVTGGYHSPALATRLAAPPAAPVPRAPALDIADHGMALTPYSHRRLDALAGYDAGLPGPAFYQRLWDDRRVGGRLDDERLLADVAGRLRARRQIASTADLVALRQTAVGLAELRGHADLWRTDLRDAVRATLVKDEVVVGGHPIEAEVDDLLRGGERGALAAGTTLPPLVHDLHEQLAAHGLAFSEALRDLDLAFADAAERGRSRLLHRLRLVGIAGVRRTAGSDFAAGSGLARPWERWCLHWSPETEASAIEASSLGTTVASAAEAVLVERLTGGGARAAAAAAAAATILPSPTATSLPGLAAAPPPPVPTPAEAVAAVVLDAALAGLDHLVRDQGARLAAALAGDPEFASVARATGILLHLQRFDQALGVAGDHDLGALLAQAWERALWLLEAGVGEAEAVVGGLRTIVAVWERCRPQVLLDGTLLDEVLARVRAGHGPPLARGAAAGARWTLGLDDAPAVLAMVRSLAAPEALGDALGGIFALAREAVQRRRDVLAAIEHLVDDWDAEEFLVALPAMRLAFVRFPPRERHHVAVALAALIGGEPAGGGSVGGDPTEAVPDAGMAARGLRHEAAVLALARRLGLRCGGWGDALAGAASPVLAIASAPAVAGDPAIPPPGPPQHPPEIRRMRWRLILGPESETALGGLAGADREQDQALDFLYSREGADEGEERNAVGGMGPSQLTVPEWINRIHTLFPKRTIERLERDALERYQLQEMVTDPALLRRAEPSQHLLRAILHTKHLMNQEVLALARDLVRRVVEQLMERLAVPVRQPFQGARLRRPTSLRIARNFDARTTIRRNLAHWDAQRRTLAIRTPCFHSRVRRHSDRWQVIVLVDESGSMADNVIHAAVTAAILVGLPAIRTHLVLFDTAVVDVSDHAGDPVETIMKVQLGGGTDIARALVYAEGLIDQPRRAMVVLISDFIEGGSREGMLASIRRLVEQGTAVLGLAALSADADPVYDREMAAQMVRCGARVGAMTPGELAGWIAEQVG